MKKYKTYTYTYKKNDDDMQIEDFVACINILKSKSAVKDYERILYKIAMMMDGDDYE